MVYQAAGAGGSHQACARNAGYMYGISKDFSKVQLGAAVYGTYTRGGPHGHVGIYIGNGMVAHNIGYVKIEPLEQWIKTYQGECWGWATSSEVNHEYQITKGLIGKCRECGFQ